MANLFEKGLIPAGGAQKNASPSLAIDALEDKLEASFGQIQGQKASTGTGGTIGEIAISGLTTDGIVMVIPAENLGAVAVQYVEVLAGKIKVWGINTSTQAVAAIDSKQMMYSVLKLA